MIKNTVRQYNRTALFAKVSQCAESIVSLLSGVENQESITDEEVRLIEQHLLVRSVEDFEQKFPSVLYFLQVNRTILFFAERPVGVNEKSIHEIPLVGVKELWQALLPESNFHTHSHIKVSDDEALSYRLFRNQDGIKRIKKLKEQMYSVLSECMQIGNCQELQELQEEIQTVMYDVRSIFPLFMEDMEQQEKDMQSASQRDRCVGMEKVHRWLSKKLVVSDQICSIQNVSDSNGKSYINVDSEEWKEMLLAAFCPGIRRYSETEKKLYRRMYDRAVQEFYRIVKEISEIRLGVQAYFQQGKEKAENMELLVLNASPHELILPQNQQRLEVFLRTVNTKSDCSSTIWTGILLRVCMVPHFRKNIRKHFMTGEYYVSETVDKETVSSILEITGKYRIMMFYQYESKKVASHQSFAKNGSRQFVEGGNIYENNRYSKYLTCCYPNLTVLDEEEWYIGAAFVAAGMFAAMQRDTECEKGISALPKELHAYSHQTKMDIQNVKYGCLFASEDDSSGWGGVANMMLICARSLFYRDGGYEPVYRVLADTYREQC